MTSLDLFVSPLGRVEGDLDVRVTIDDGVVTSAWTEAAMFRGFEIILRGKDPQAGLVVCPRICGICGGSHLYKSAYALDTAWRTHMPPNATLVRNICQACETLQSIPRYFYALFAIDLTNKNYAKSSLYDEAVRRFAPYVGTSYQPGVVLSGKPVEVYAIFGGQWPHSSFMVPGGVMCAPTLSDVTRAIAILEHWNDNWLEGQWLGCSVDRWLENKTWADVLAWVDENEAQYNSDCGFFIRYCLDVGLDKYGQGVGNYLATGTYFDPSLYENPTIEGRNAALIGRSGVYADGSYYEFDQANVREDVTHSFYTGDRPLHPFDGETIPIDPEQGRKQGKYSWAKSPRYAVGDLGNIPLEAGPLARRIAAAGPNAAAHQDNDPLFGDIMEKIGPSVMVRQLARMHEGPKYYKWARQWLDQLELKESFYTKPTEHAEGKGFGSTEAARGSLSDWIVIEDSKIKNYQVVTPTAWNIGPRDGSDVLGPIERALVGSPIVDVEDPVELGHVARSFDSCLVCTVHAYDGKTGKELSQFVINGMVCELVGPDPDVDLEPPGCEVLIVGCGNLLRGDDGVGPVLVRHLWERGVPDGAKLVDGGTAGMDVAFQMRGADRVVIVDACATGAEPGTVYRVPGEELAELPPAQGLHTHSFRWDHAIAFARWALADACPEDITVFLIEASSVDLGADLSEPVTAAMESVIDLLDRDYLIPLRPAPAADVTVEFTADGYLRLDAALAATRFPSDAVVAMLRDDDFWLIPLRGPRSGGLLLKQRTPAGDRSVLVKEQLRETLLSGEYRAFWDDDQSALRIPLEGGVAP